MFCNSLDSISQPKLPPLIHGRQGKDNHINGSDTSLNQLKSPSQSSGVSSGYGSQPESGRPSLQEQVSVDTVMTQGPSLLHLFPQTLHLW